MKLLDRIAAWLARHDRAAQERKRGVDLLPKCSRCLDPLYPGEYAGGLCEKCLSIPSVCRELRPLGKATGR